MAKQIHFKLFVVHQSRGLWTHPRTDRYTAHAYWTEL